VSQSDGGLDLTRRGTYHSAEGEKIYGVVDEDVWSDPPPERKPSDGHAYDPSVRKVVTKSKSEIVPTRRNRRSLFCLVLAVRRQRDQR